MFSVFFSKQTPERSHHSRPNGSFVCHKRVCSPRECRVTHVTQVQAPTCMRICVYKPDDSVYFTPVVSVRRLPYSARRQMQVTPTTRRTTVNARKPISRLHDAQRPVAPSQTAARSVLSFLSRLATDIPTWNTSKDKSRIIYVCE